MKRLITLLLLTTLCNVSPVSAQRKIIEQKQLNFGKDAQYSIVAETNEDDSTDNPQYGSTAIILRKNNKELARFYSFALGEGCPADGFHGITVRGRYFTIEDSYCAGFYFVLTYTTFRYDTKRKEIVLHRYGESYVYRGDPEKYIPDNSYLVKRYIPFKEVTADLLLNLRKHFKVMN